MLEPLFNTVRRPKSKVRLKITKAISKSANRLSKWTRNSTRQPSEWNVTEQFVDSQPLNFQYSPYASLTNVQHALPSPPPSPPPLSIETVQRPAAVYRTSTGLTKITICPYTADWAQRFADIASDLEADLTDEQAPYLRIEHIGSTSIPDMSAKPIIDIAIVVDKIRPFTDPSDSTIVYVDKVHYALVWGNRPGGYQYIGDGGVRGRPSFKLFRPDLPSRNIFLIEEGSILERSYMDFRRVLGDEANKDLIEECSELKERLAEREWEDVMEYAQEKNVVVSKVLRRGGWSEEMIREKEGLACRDWCPEMPY